MEILGPSSGRDALAVVVAVRPARWPLAPRVVNRLRSGVREPLRAVPVPGGNGNVICVGVLYQPALSAEGSDAGHRDHVSVAAEFAKHAFGFGAADVVAFGDLAKRQLPGTCDREGAFLLLGSSRCAAPEIRHDV